MTADIWEQEIATSQDRFRCWHCDRLVPAPGLKKETLFRQPAGLYTHIERLIVKLGVADQWRDTFKTIDGLYIPAMCKHCLGNAQGPLAWVRAWAAEEKSLPSVDECLRILNSWGWTAGTALPGPPLGTYVAGDGAKPTRGRQQGQDEGRECRFSVHTGEMRPLLLLR